MLGWVQGMWCDPTELDRLFRLRATRRLKAGGYLRFRHWRLYAERGLAGAPAAVWLWGGTVTIEYAGDTLAQYRVTLEADGHRLREVDEPRLFVTGHASPQPFLPPLTKVEWHPAWRVAPYRPRRKHSHAAKQEPLFTDEREAAAW